MLEEGDSVRKYVKNVDSDGSDSIICSVCDGSYFRHFYLRQKALVSALFSLDIKYIQNISNNKKKRLDFPLFDSIE